MEPMLRFKADDGSEFPAWVKKTLGDLGEFIKGAPLSKADIAPEGNPMILYGELYTTYGEVAYEIARSTNRNVDDKYRSKIGDVLIPTSGETPEEISTATCVMKEGVILAGDLYIYRTVDEIDGRIMSYLLNHQANKAISCIAQGKSVVHVQAKELRNITVVFPPEMGEQRKIVDFLSAVDDVIAAQEAEVAAWEKRKKGVMQKLFSQEVRFKADDGSDFPDWEEKTLGNLGTFLKGAPLSKSDITDEGTPLILYGELYTTYAEVAYSIARRTDKKVPDKFYSKVGDVVIPTSGETPEEISTATCVMKDGVILAGDLYIYRPATNVDGRILSYLLNHQVNNAISRIAQGKSVVHVQSKELERIHVIFPPSPIEQRKIADCLASLDDVIAKAKGELDAWRELKKGLLQQMFV